MFPAMWVVRQCSGHFAQAEAGNISGMEAAFDEFVRAFSGDAV